MEKLDRYIKLTFFGSRVRLRSKKSGKYIYKLCIYLIQQYKIIRYGKKEIPTLSFIAVLLLNLADRLFTKEVEIFDFENKVRQKLNLIINQAEILLKRCNNNRHVNLALVKYSAVE